jgi:hypothetical protein
LGGDFANSCDTSWLDRSCCCDRLRTRGVGRISGSLATLLPELVALWAAAAAVTDEAEDIAAKRDPILFFRSDSPTLSRTRCFIVAPPFDLDDVKPSTVNLSGCDKHVALTLLAIIPSLLLLRNIGLKLAELTVKLSACDAALATFLLQTCVESMAFMIVVLEGVAT